MNSDLSEQSGMPASGILPMRRPAEYPDLKLKDPAVNAMTDFMHKFPISVAPERPIDEALADMMRFGIRALLVISGESVVGLITSYDIEGIRPVKFSQRSNITRREYIRVGDIMTEWEDLPTVDWSTIQSARISDLLEIFHGVSLMHLLVVEGEHAGGPTVVRGLISRARIDRRLNVMNGISFDARIGAVK
ncbi:MAG: domain containing rane protein [Gammaproteobacteria bacterium]|nr:domain containing rane protein [Gammaproteobacteria bacterium]